MKINILEYGAIGDGSVLNTAAIQQAIDACAAAGGGTVVVPAGRFLTGTIRLKSNIELHLEHGAVLKASAELGDYNELEEYPQNYDCLAEKWCGKHLIIAVEQENVAITGSGTIEGCGDAYFGGELKFCTEYIWREGYYETGEENPVRPGQMICFIECRHVSVRDITLKNSTAWNLFLHGCDYVKVRGLTILNSKQHANTDGIDIDCCSFVTVSDCLIDTGDDCIAIRGSSQRLTVHPGKKCEYITVSNCVLSNSPCAVRFGVGTGEIHHVNISDCVIARSGEGLTFMTGWQGRGGVRISDINISNITGDDVGIPLQIYAREERIERVNIHNYRTNCKCNVRIQGNPGWISDLVLDQMDIYDTEHEIHHPEDAKIQRGDAILKIEGVERLVLDRVRLFLQDDYFADRPNVIQMRDTTTSVYDLKVIYKGEEKLLTETN